MATDRDYRVAAETQLAAIESCSESTENAAAALVGMVATLVHAIYVLCPGDAAVAETLIDSGVRYGLDDYIQYCKRKEKE
tara:strand:+ start:209 stop:448 length:240 start_codon:yes stop_codon:yes gene_type:complete